MSDVRDLVTIRVDQDCVLDEDGWCYVDLGDGRGAARVPPHEWARLRDRFARDLDAIKTWTRRRLLGVVPAMIGVLVIGGQLRLSADTLAGLIGLIAMWSILLGLPAWLLIGRSRALAAATRRLRRSAASYPRVSHAVTSRRRRWLDQIERFSVLLAVPVVMTMFQSLHPRGPPDMSLPDMLILGLGIPILLFAAYRGLRRRLAD